MISSTSLKQDRLYMGMGQIHEAVARWAKVNHDDLSSKEIRLLPSDRKTSLSALHEEKTRAILKKVESIEGELLISVHGNRKIYCSQIGQYYLNGKLILKLAALGKKFRLIDKQGKDITHRYLINNYARYILESAVPTIEEMRELIIRNFDKSAIFHEFHSL